MKSILRVALPCLFFFLSCNHKAADKPKQELTQLATKSALPDFAEADSLELIYYSIPDDQRSYKRLMLTDTTLVRNLTRIIMQDTAGLRECPHPIKLYLFRNGDVFKTVYANTSDSCRYFAYAIGAKPVYVPMQAHAAVLLDSLVGKTK